MPLLKGQNEVEKPAVILTGHRGAAGHAPENTLSAIRKAMEFKVNRIEIDVQQTRDGVVVLMHDLTVNRTTNGTGKVKNLSFKEIRKLNAAANFQSGKSPAEAIPTLEEALELINGKTQFIIEIKKGDDYYPDITQHIVSLIQKHKAHAWCIIHSFDDEVLRAVHEADSQIVLHSVTLTRRSKQLRKMPYISEVSIYHRFVTPSWIHKIHKMGKRVNVWTVNEPDIIDRILKMGADGIISDYPDRVLNHSK